MATGSVSYGTDGALTVTNLHSIASSSTRVAGWTSASIDNTSELALDYQVSAQFQVSTSVAPTDGKTISVYAYAVHLDTPTWPDIFSAGTEGTEGTATVHTEAARDDGLVLLWVGRVTTATSAVYVMPPRSIAQAFGGFVPPLFALWVTQDTGQALNSAGNAVYSRPLHVTMA